jgi:predicted ATPase
LLSSSTYGDDCAPLIVGPERPVLREDERPAAGRQVAELVAKSLIAADRGGAEPRLRLLETTRAYSLENLAESGEHDIFARRHAKYS